MGIISKYLSIILSGDRGINGTRKGQAIQCNLWSKEKEQKRNNGPLNTAQKTLNNVH
jgi:hypothetical protein